jgi:chorismate mutase
MTLEELRNRIDILDRQLVELLSERARAALMIGHLKAATSLPVYEPARERVIYTNVRAANKGPLPDIELTHIYERIIDVMRALQRNELASERHAQAMASGTPAAGYGRPEDVASGSTVTTGVAAADQPSGHGTGAQPSQRQSFAAGGSHEAPETGKKQ